MRHCTGRLAVIVGLLLAGAAALAQQAPVPQPPNMQAPVPESAPRPARRPLVLLIAPYEQPKRDLVAMTLGWMCREAQVEFDAYYAADHKEGGLFSQHGSNIIGGHHALRIARALAAYKTTVVRMGGASVFDSLVRTGAHKVIEAPESIISLYGIMLRELGLKPPAEAVALASDSAVPLAALFPECIYRKALAVPLETSPEGVQKLKELGVKTIWTVAPAGADTANWNSGGMEIKPAVDLSGADPNLEVVQRWREKSTGIDTLEPIIASYLLPLSIREDRLILAYKSRGPEATKRRDQMLELTSARPQDYAFGRWYGDPELVPLARWPMGYNVIEPCRHILTVFGKYPAALPQPAKSWMDLEPGDEQLKTWAKEGKILATWVLHSGELSHDDAVMLFYDWCAMTKQKIGSGVHWQRYYYDPDAVEPMHVPAGEGGVLGLVEPVLHSAGNGIIWETAGDPVKIAAMMKASREKIARIAGERFAPRGVYCFGDNHGVDKSAAEPTAAQLALYRAVKEAGFEYMIITSFPGDSRIVWRDGDFVVLNQAGRWCGGSPFVRGFPDTFAATEKKLAAAGKPGWLVGALDSPIHGSPIYTGRPYGGKDPQPRIFDYYDYLQKHGETGKVISATPRTIARYARLIADIEGGGAPKAAAPRQPAAPAPATSAPRAANSPARLATMPAAPAAEVWSQVGPPRPPADRRFVLVEAETFFDLGGWSVDQQFMDVMGSPFLLAHGLGKPVAPARTKAAFAAPGRYRAWVRTRDWVPPHGPGKFRIRIDGQEAGRALGAAGDGTWQWHDAGLVEIKDKLASIEIEDLTGFDGRVDAILFVAEEAGDFRPPNADPEMAAFRNKAMGLAEPAEGGEYDLVIIGGGYAGTCSAIAAGRLGLKVALVQDRPVLGGNASSEVRVGPIGKLNLQPFPKNAEIMQEILSAPGAGQASGGFKPRPSDEHVRKLVEAEKHVSLFLEMHAFAVEKEGQRIRAVMARHIRTGDARRFRARLFADCTGDGTIGVLAGAQWRMGREGRDQTGETLAPEKADGQVLGMTNMWCARKDDAPSTFPPCPWALQITEESFEISRPKYPPNFRDYAYIGGWNWESGFDKDPIAQAEAVRDHNLRAIYGTWDYLKNKSPEKGSYAKAQLEWVAYVLGKRESRRLMGDMVLSQQDLLEPRIYPDGVVTATWYFDLHFPHPENSKFFPGQEYRSIAYDDPNWKLFLPNVPGKMHTIKPYPIPLRCFYSKDVPNLFMAGRNISATHVGLAPVRVQNTTGMMGTMIGRAAALCKARGVEPRALGESQLDALKELLSSPDGQTLARLSR